MRVLELYKGTGSVGKVFEEMGAEVISVDIEAKYNPTHCEDIMTWNYKEYEVGHFDIITASPVCLYWSRLRNSWVGRCSKTIKPDGTVITKEDLEIDINNKGKPMVNKTFEIIDYFQPQFYWLENPLGSKMWSYIDSLNRNDYYNNDFDYCKYSDWGYKKPTRFITNYDGVITKRCKNDCENMITIEKRTTHKQQLGNLKYQKETDKKVTQKIHRERMGTSKTIITEDGTIVRVNSKELREKYKDYPNIQQKEIHAKTLGSWGKAGTKQVGVGGGTNRDDRYRIPPLIIEELIKPMFGWNE